MEKEKYTDANSKGISMRIPNELLDKIDELAEKAERTRSEEIRFIIKKYIEIQEKN